MVIGGRTILRKKFRPKTMLLAVKLSRTLLVTWLWWGGAHWIWRLQLFSPLHHNIIMHILHKGFSICFLKWWQGECASQSRESLVGDHFLYLCDLYVWCRGITVRRNSVLVTPRDQRVSFLISLNYHPTYIVVLVWRVSEYTKKSLTIYNKRGHVADFHPLSFLALHVRVSLWWQLLSKKLW